MNPVRCKETLSRSQGLCLSITFSVESGESAGTPKKSENYALHGLIKMYHNLWFCKMTGQSNWRTNKKRKRVLCRNHHIDIVQYYNMKVSLHCVNITPMHSNLES